MGIDISAGRIRLTGGGDTKFDTNDKALVVLDYRAGSFTIPARTKSQGSIHTTTTVTLASGLPAGCTHCFGLIRQSSFAGNQWFPLGGTTVLFGGGNEHDYLASTAGQYSVSPGGAGYENSFVSSVVVAVTFLVVGTTLRVEIDQFAPTDLYSGNFTGWPTLTVNWHAFLGAFDQASVSGNKVFKADDAGRCAIWANDANDAPFTSPQSNLDRLLFHSQLETIGIVDSRSGSDTMAQANDIVTLFNHGLGYAPLVFGTVTVGGRVLPVTGTAMTDDFGNGLSIAANTTAVVANRARLLYAGNLTFGWNLHLSNYGVTGAGTIRRPAYYDGFEATKSRFRAGYFDTNNLGYLAATSSGGIAVVNGRTIEFEVGDDPYVFIDGGFVPVALGYRQRFSAINHLVEYQTTFRSSTYPGIFGSTQNATLQRLKVVG